MKSLTGHSKTVVPHAKKTLDKRMNIQTPATYCFMLICILVSVPSAFIPSYFELFSGELPHEYWWQNFSMAFQHGAKGSPIAVLGHLSLNITLLVTCSRLTEKLLGSARFLILTFAAWTGFFMAQWLSGVWINGSSGIIWAYSPFLLLPIKWAKQDDHFKKHAERSRILLIVMWGVVTVAMGFVPLLFNPDLNLLYSFFFGNLFHASATLVGLILYLIWRGTISKPETLTKFD